MAGVAIVDVILGNYRDLFAAIAESSATLTGLLFVAMSVAPRRQPSVHSAVVLQVRAAAALLAFTSALAVSLFGLVPGNNVGYPATVLGIIGILFTAAGMRSIFGSTSDFRLLWQQSGLMVLVLLLLTFGFELGSGVVLILNSRSSTALMVVSNVLVASLLIGVARTWELVGDRDTGLLASIAVLSGHAGTPRGRAGPSGPDRSSSGETKDGPEDPQR
jgi:hypothetical protein